MKLSTLDFAKLLPAFMREDGAVKGLSEALNELVPQLHKDIAKLTSWDRLNELPEAELDALAWELNILWYNRDAPLSVKREIVKNSDLIYKKLGTKWAVENVIVSYFGEGYISEWFEYEGEPGHFRVYSSNPSVSNDKLSEFISLLSKIKRASSILDGIYITLTGQAPLCAGAAVHEVSKEQYSIGAKAPA